MVAKLFVQRCLVVLCCPSKKFLSQNVACPSVCGSCFTLQEFELVKGFGA